MKTASPALLGATISLFLNLAQEGSETETPFLDACSNLEFFQACRSPISRHDTASSSRYGQASHIMVQVHEGVCLILQKLSCIPTNRRFFEKASLVEPLTELGRKSASSFLQMNIKSILKHLTPNLPSTKRSHASAMSATATSALDVSGSVDLVSLSSVSLSESCSMDPSSRSPSMDSRNAFGTSSGPVD